MTELNNKELFALLQTQDEKKEVLEQWGTHFEKINKFNNKSIAIIGCGGVGIRIAQIIAQLCYFCENVTVDLYDPDLFEEKNADRQLHGYNHLKKAVALKLHLEQSFPRTAVKFRDVPFRYPCSWEVEEGLQHDIIFIAADKNKPKVYISENENCLKDDGICILAGNEYEYYQSTLFRKDMLKDMTKVYVDLLEKDKEESEPCTGEITLSEPQLVLFNYLAATSAVQLAWGALTADHLFTKEGMVLNCHEGTYVVNHSFKRV